MPWIDGATNTKLAALVVEAYGPACWLCRDPIDLALPRRHPFGLSLDHVTPRSKGGDNSVANLRPAHLRCNLQRGPRRPTSIRTAVVHPLMALVFSNTTPTSPARQAGDSHSSTPEKTRKNPI